MKTAKKAVLLVLSAALLVGASVLGTVAYLQMQTQTITNTFTPSTIEIELTESFNVDSDNDGNKDSWSEKMVPGQTITKDPKITVKVGSEACWLFVEVDASTNFSDFMTYEMAENWTELADMAGVYWRKIETTDMGTGVSVLKNDQVTVNASVTKNQMDALASTTYPTLKFTAYAIQSAGFDTAAAAWEEVSK